MSYRVTLTDNDTGDAFMYHQTLNRKEALDLAELYASFKGVNIELTKQGEPVDHAQV